jgi:hypothetical protein
MKVPIYSSIPLQCRDISGQGPAGSVFMSKNMATTLSILVVALVTLASNAKCAQAQQAGCTSPTTNFSAVVKATGKWSRGDGGNEVAMEFTIINHGSIAIPIPWNISAHSPSYMAIDQVPCCKWWYLSGTAPVLGLLNLRNLNNDVSLPTMWSCIYCKKHFGHGCMRQRC